MNEKYKDYLIALINKAKQQQLSDIEAGILCDNTQRHKLQAENEFLKEDLESEKAVHRNTIICYEQLQEKLGKARKTSIECLEQTAKYEAENGELRKRIEELEEEWSKGDDRE